MATPEPRSSTFSSQPCAVALAASESAARTPRLASAAMRLMPKISPRMLPANRMSSAGIGAASSKALPRRWTSRQCSPSTAASRGSIRPPAWNASRRSRERPSMRLLARAAKTQPR